MAWDFSTEPEFQEQLDWMRDFVREEIWPIESIFAEIERGRASRVRSPRCRSRSASAGCGRPTSRPTSAARASARSSSA